MIKEKSRRKISKALALAMILSLLLSLANSNRAFADDNKYEKVGKELKELGVITGDANGKLEEFSNLTREQSLVILSRLLGEENNAKATNYNTSFKDVKKGNFYTPYIEYAKLRGWTNGLSPTEFGLGKSINTKSMVTLMLRALGHSADWSKEDIMKKAKDIGLLENISAGESDAIIRGEVFILMKNTLNANINGTKERLSDVLGLTKPKEGSSDKKDDSKKGKNSSDTVINSGEFKVLNVNSTNLREIEVEFSQPIDPLSLRDAFHEQGAGLGKLEAKLGSKNTVAIITADTAMQNLKEYKINIRGLRSTSRLEINRENIEFKSSDVEYPTIEEIKVTGPKSLDIYFTEPIDFNKSTNKRLELTLDKKKVHSSMSFDKSNERLVSVKLGNEMQNGKEYSLRTFGFMDFAGYPSKDDIMQFTYERDTEAPTAEVLEANQEYVVVKFNKPVKGVRLDNFYHTNKSWHPYEAYANVTDLKLSKNQLRLFDNKSLDTLVLKFVDIKRFSKSGNFSHGNYPLSSGTVEFGITGTARGSANFRIRDEWNNNFTNATFSLEIQADTTYPEVQKVNVKSEKELVIEFNKPIILNAKNYEFYFEDKKVPTNSYKVLSDGNKDVKILFNNAELVSKEVKLVISDVYDASVSRLKLQNAYETKVVFSDKSFLGVKEVLLRASESKTSKYYDEPTLLVYFEEPVDNASATDPNNYRFTSDGKHVFKLDGYYYMPNELILEIRMSRQDYLDRIKNKNAKIIVSENVKDISGNGYDGFSMTYDILKSSKSKAPKLISNFPISIKKDRLTMEISFDETLFQNDAYAINNDMFNIKNRSKKLDINEVSLNDKKIVIRLNEYDEESKFPSDVSNLVVEFRNLNYDNGGIGNVQGTIIENFIAKSDLIKDEIPPKLIKFVYSDDEGIKYAIYNKSNKYIELHYDEMLNPNVLSALTYDVNFYNAYYNSEKLPIRMVQLDSSKKIVKVYFDYEKMSESEKQNFDENVNYATNGSGSNMFYGNDKNEYYPIFTIRISDGNYVHDMKGNAAENEDTTVYVRRQ